MTGAIWSAVNGEESGHVSLAPIFPITAWPPSVAWTCPILMICEPPFSEVAESFDLGGIGAEQDAFDTTKTRTRRRRSWRFS